MKKYRLKKKSLIPTLLFFTCAQSVIAQEDTRNGNQDDSPLEAIVSGLSFHINAGGYYNNNITVSELDVNVGNGDIAAKLSAQVKFEKEFAHNTEFGAGYKISSTIHEEFSRFDIVTHLLSTKLEHDFGDFKAGVSYYFADSNLNQSDFLTLNQISPYAAKFFGKKAYLRGYYRYADKKFQNSPLRDAKVHKAGGDLYYFLDGRRQYIQSGYSYENSDAFAGEFDYGAHTLRLRYIKRIPFRSRQAKLKIGWRYEKRNYKNITPSIGIIRNDNRHRLRADLELPVTDNFYGQIELTQAIYNSNLPIADYERLKLAFSIGTRF